MNLKSIFLTISLYLTITPSASLAWQEYGHLSEDERDEINSPRRIDSEYESDRLTYEFLNEWNQLWASESKIFQYSAGSLGPTRFLTQGRFKLIEPISKNITFQLTYLEQGDYKTNRKSLIFEFYYSLNSWLSLSLYGDPATLKRDDDLGFAFNFNLKNDSKIRLYYTLVDFSYNKRNEDKSTYIDKPISYGAVWRKSSKENKSFYELSFRHDMNTQLYFEENLRTYIYGFKNLSFHSRSLLNEKKWLQTSFNINKSFEGDTLNTDNGVERWDYLGADGLLQFSSPTSLIPLWGLRANYAAWESTRGNVIHNDIIPHAWFDIYNQQSGSHHHRMLLGYEFTWHRAQGDSSLRSQLDTNDNIEHRMNYKYSISINKKTEFNILLTFDLDDFGTGETWEGGSMQYSMTF